jgi:hypothetical protein
VDIVVFFLCCAGVMQFEVGKVRRRMAGDTVADSAGRQFCR